MMLFRAISFIFFILFISPAFPQQISGDISGKISDIDTHVPLPGATVVITGSDPVKGSVSDVDGKFRIEKITPGRYDIKASYIGYEPCLLREVLVGSGKETVLNIFLKESVSRLGAIEITASQDKKEALNSMAVISARQINMEEARRFAGGFDDPAHLVSSFAGVADNMNSNGIVIRGNAPKGLQWRMEGIEIANPSHFANMTTFGGGGITALSAMMLARSDFYTSAFPAEYGNALSGVFDLHLRSGNPDRREYAFQAGLTGIDASAGGPYMKGKGATYLINYRYSLFALLEPIMPENAGLIRYQDLSFKTDFPASKAGVFSLWGIGSTDISGQNAVENADDWVYEYDRIDGVGKTYMGAAGLTHKVILGKKTYLSSSIAASGNGINIDNKILDSDLTAYPDQEIKNYTWKITFSSQVNHKFGPRHTNRTGFTIDRISYDQLIMKAPGIDQPMITIADGKGRSLLCQVFSESRIDLSEKFQVNAGINTQYFALSGHYSIEPRFGMKWMVAPSHTLSAGYGLHSRLEMLQVYLIERTHGDEISYPNKNLDFTKAQHFVAGYDYAINEYTHFKAEAYYQHLFNVPVITDSSWSMLNVEQDWFISDSLVNKGKGNNYGIDLTLERFLHNGLYYVVSTSLFRSLYTGGDGIERNSRYDKTLLFSIAAGKEWYVGRGHKNNVLGLNGKLSLFGGDRISPVNDAGSHMAKEVIYDETRAFENRKPDVYYLHMTLNYRMNRKSHASIWSLQLLNILGSPEFFGYKYNLKDDTIDKDQQTIIMPNISYRIEF
jgi:hypothetical protein